MKSRNICEDVVRKPVALAVALGISCAASGVAWAQSFELSNLNGSNGFVINGGDPSNSCCRPVGGAGDVNDDGFDDVIIGANNGGRSYVVFGSQGSRGPALDLSTLNGANGFAINGMDAERSGHDVSRAGDVNGDGIDDLIIGAYRASPGGRVHAGAAYVVFGKDSSFASSLDLSVLDGSNGFVINGVNAGDRAGLSVSAAGDVNGDGIDDLIIGATGADPRGIISAGASYVVFGDPQGFPTGLELVALNGANGFVINGINADDMSGDPVSGAGDINGDGLDDVIIGAPSANPGGRISAGTSYVVFGTNGGFAVLNLEALNGANGFAIHGIDGSDSAGTSVSGAGDVNGDGFDDVVIGAPGVDGFIQPRFGAAYVVFGKAADFPASLELSTLNGANGFVMPGTQSLASFGSSVSAAGDVNGDGIDDLVIGAHSTDRDGKVSVGESYVIFGNDAGFPDLVRVWLLNGSDGFAITGIDSGDQAGRSVGAAGDVNDDGFDDLVIGAWFADPDSESYVVYGSEVPIFADGFED